MKAHKTKDRIGLASTGDVCTHQQKRREAQSPFMRSWPHWDCPHPCMGLSYICTSITRDHRKCHLAAKSINMSTESGIAVHPPNSPHPSLADRPAGFDRTWFMGRWGVAWSTLPMWKVSTDARRSLTIRTRRVGDRTTEKVD
jgi:hypothetical protein